MKRSTWIAVLVTASVLVIAGNLPRLPWENLASSWRSGLERRVAAWPRRSLRPHAPAATTPSAAPRAANRALIPFTPPRLLVTPATTGSANTGFAYRIRQLPTSVTASAAAGTLSGLVALFVFVVLSRRDRRGKVWQLARRGFSPARIAPRARVPQDAVRTLLTPGLGTRR